jgi:hypothetical protein
MGALRARRRRRRPRGPNDPADAIYSAAAYLRASGALRELRAALFAYNHADWYVDEVLARARRYAGSDPTLDADDATALCATGPTALAAGANLPDHPLMSETLGFLRRVAAIYGRPVVVTTGTHHSRYTIDGQVSDHADGHAADLGMAANGGSDDSPIGDRIMAACLTAAGQAPDQALTDAQRGGSTPSSTTAYASSASGRPTKAATTTTTCTSARGRCRGDASAGQDASAVRRCYRFEFEGRAAKLIGRATRGDVACPGGVAAPRPPYGVRAGMGRPGGWRDGVFDRWRGGRRTFASDCPQRAETLQMLVPVQNVRRHVVFISLLAAGVALRLAVLWRTGRRACGSTPSRTSAARATSCPTMCDRLAIRCSCTSSCPSGTWRLSRSSSTLWACCWRACSTSYLSGSGARPAVAALGAAPALLDAYQVSLEQFVLSEALFELLIVSACALLLWRRPPRVAAAAVAGLLIALAGLTRSVGVALIAPPLVVALASAPRRPWPAVVLAISFVVPLAGYAALYHHNHGRYALAGEGGRFLYGRVAQMADCAQVGLSRAERELWPPEPLGHRHPPGHYLWSRRSPLQRVPPGARDRLAGGFAREIIRHQPLDYAAVVARDSLKAFVPTAALRQNDAPTVWRYTTDDPVHPPIRCASSATTMSGHGPGSSVCSPAISAWSASQGRYSRRCWRFPCCARRRRDAHGGDPVDRISARVAGRAHGRRRIHLALPRAGRSAARPNRRARGDRSRPPHQQDPTSRTGGALGPRMTSPPHGARAPADETS